MAPTTDHPDDAAALVSELVASARAADPGLPVETAAELAAAALAHVAADPGLDAPALARLLLAQHPTHGATAANVVAVAAVGSDGPAE